MRNCEECRFFKRLTEGEEPGRCKRYPPTRNVTVLKALGVPAETETEYPVVDGGEEGCGEWLGVIS